MEMIYDFLVFISKWNEKKILKRLKRNGLELAYLSDNIRNNYKFVFAAVAQNGLAIEYASDELKNNYEIVLRAVQQNGFAYQWISNKLKYNLKIILASITQNIKVVDILPQNLNVYKNFLISRIDYEVYY